MSFAEHVFVLPSGITGLACLVEAAAARGQKVEFDIAGCQTISYWERMGFFDLFGVSGVEGAGARNPPAGRFAEIRRVADIDEVDAITTALVEVVQPRGDEYQIRSHVLSEALNNVCQHSGAAGFCSAQYYGNENVVRLAIADAGRGLWAALAELGVQDDREAISMALRPGVSGRSKAEQLAAPREMRNRGIGLTAIHRLTLGTGGEIQIWSGWCRYDGFDNAYRRTAAPWQGTLVVAKLPRNTQYKGYREIMRGVAMELREAERVGAQRRPLRRLP